MNFEILKFVNGFARATFGSFTKRCVAWLAELANHFEYVKTDWKVRGPFISNLLAFNMFNVTDSQKELVKIDPSWYDFTDVSSDDNFNKE